MEKERLRMRYKYTSLFPFQCISLADTPPTTAELVSIGFAPPPSLFSSQPSDRCGGALPVLCVTTRRTATVGFFSRSWMVAGLRLPSNDNDGIAGSRDPLTALLVATGPQ